MVEIHVAILRRGINWEELHPAVKEIGEIEYPDDYQNALDPLTLTIIVGSTLALGKLIIRLGNELRGGVVIDLSKSPVEVSRSGKVPYGFFVTIGADGQKVEIIGKDEPKDSLERMVEGLLSLAVNPATATAEMVHAVVNATVGRHVIKTSTKSTTI